MSQYHKLYTPQDSAIVFVDHQPQMLFGVASIDRATAGLQPSERTNEATCVGSSSTLL